MSEWFAKGGVHKLSPKTTFVIKMQSLGVEKTLAIFYWKKLNHEADKEGIHIAHLIIPALCFAPLFHTTDTAVDFSIALNRMCSATGLTEELRLKMIRYFEEIYASGCVDEVFRLEWMALIVAMPRQLDEVASLLLHDGANAADLYFALEKGRKTLDELADAIIEASK